MCCILLIQLCSDKQNKRVSVSVGKRERKEEKVHEEK